MWGANRIHTVSKTHYWRPSLIIQLFNNAYRPYFRVWLSFASAYVSCVLVHKKNQLTVFWNTVKCKFQSLISKRMPRRRWLIVVCFIIKCAKRSDWLCQHSGSGPGTCTTVTRPFPGRPHSLARKTSGATACHNANKHSRAIGWPACQTMKKIATRAHAVKATDK